MDRDTLNMMVDGGKKRSNKDRLAAKGVSYASLICSSIEEIIDVTDQWRKSSAMLLPDEVLTYHDQNKRELDQLAIVHSSSKDIPPKLLITFQHLFTKIDAPKADQFFSSLAARHTLKLGQPVLAFCEMLKSDKVRGDDVPTARTNRYIRNGLIIAWNAHVKGETLDRIEPTERYITMEGTAIISQQPEESFSLSDEESESEESEE
jgi:hypothetical protein